MAIKKSSWRNKLYFGDNLDILRHQIPDDYVDLIYLDPPFQSGKNYNQIFQPDAGDTKGATAQIQAFEDTWYWGAEAEESYEGLLTGQLTKKAPNQKLVDLMKAMRGYLGEVPMMAYLSMMAPRLLEMRRVLKKTGSIYLHCDPTASHYLKLLMDAIFGVSKFKNEVIWHYTGGGRSKTYFSRKHDAVFYYSKSDEHTFNVDEIRVPYKETSGYAKEGIVSASGKRYMPNPKGTPVDDVWDIPIINPLSKERIGYPTQKPGKLLERIIKASSNEGDVVLDPFCGCGTTVAVAQKLKRKWIGIDITYLAIDVIAKRLEASGFEKGKHFDVEGEPSDVYSAEQLAKDKPFQFEVWVASMLNAIPTVKTGDEGVDGVLNFIDPSKKDKMGKGIIQVKGAQSVAPAMVRDLSGTIKSQKADFGILITLKKATRGMITEASKAGNYEYRLMSQSPAKKIPKIQLLTAEDLFKEPMPLVLPPTLDPYKKPKIEEQADQTDEP